MTFKPLLCDITAMKYVFNIVTNVFDDLRLEYLSFRQDQYDYHIDDEYYDYQDSINEILKRIENRNAPSLSS